VIYDDFYDDYYDYIDDLDVFPYYYYDDDLFGAIVDEFIYDVLG